MEELVKTYNPKETEGRIYKLWEKTGAFSPPKPYPLNAKPFTIVIPPPNVTGSLHMGHALNNIIQDILIRRSRMKGVPTLWVPGTDHAGIATQNVVEKELLKEGKSRHDLGREKFVKRVWQWVDEYGHIITDQLKKLGCSCDWSRQRFTMDDDYAKAVNAAFKHYYNKGWIYQGERVINWCVRCQTALSDIEVEHREVEGKLWFIRYPMRNGVIATPSEARGKQSPANAGLANKLPDSSPAVQNDNYITVATTRPETMLGDTAVAVNPQDKRYKNLIGQTVILPITKREIPIIADEAVDPKFGTGAVKVTPAHDAKDFEIAERHRLRKIKVINETGKITQIEPQGFDFTGQKALEARENIVKELAKQGLIEKIQDYNHQVPHCYRCGRVIEQMLSKQWFLKMSELAKPAIEAVKNGEIKFAPERWKKVYLNWMENCHDWCISRQIWWGHKIPIKGSDDVLDTWFSSALWPFATLGWPQGISHSEQSEESAANAASETSSEIPRQARDDTISDLDYFYPTTVLSTARDIIYLWVARMIFSGFEFMGEKPFSTIYIHPTIFNISGKRMSKSLGTGLDPVELIEKYGADAVRFGLCYINTGTQDIKFDEKAVIAGQKFANKIWNIARFTILQMQNANLKNQNENVKSKIKPITEADQKITQSLNHLITSVNSDLDNFRFGQAAHSLYDFIWHDFADRYIESSKLKTQNSKLDNNPAILFYVLTTSLKLLHPLMPHLTEEIWQTLKKDNLVAPMQKSGPRHKVVGEEKMLILAKWPEEKSKIKSSNVKSNPNVKNI